MKTTTEKKEEIKFVPFILKIDVDNEFEYEILKRLFNKPNLDLSNFVNKDRLPKIDRKLIEATTYSIYAALMDAQDNPDCEYEPKKIRTQEISDN